MEKCKACERLHEAMLSASADLVKAQRELARQTAANDSATFLRLWEVCSNALNVLQEHRRAMTTHLASHGMEARSQGV
jgi:hypothetical protein